MSRVNVAVGIVRDSLGRVLIAQRKAGTHQGGLWEFPGGKFENFEDEQQALSRELYEELNIKPVSTSPLIKVCFDYPGVKVHLHVREVDSFEGEPLGREGQLLRWVTLDQLDEYPFPEANKAILSAITLGPYYAIINGNDTRQIVLDLQEVAKQGVSLVQVRAKGLCAQDAEHLMASLRDQCDKLKLSYLLNSQMQVNRLAGEGVHLTSPDLMVLNERPEGAGLVAASCHNLQELRKAEQLALDFAVLSPIKVTSSHPDAKALGWAQFEEWISEVNIPVFALGGMRMQDYEQALMYGAQGISGISAFKILNKNKQLTKNKVKV